MAESTGPRGFLLRGSGGFYSLIARLDAEVDYVAVEKAFLPESM